MVVETQTQSTVIDCAVSSRLDTSFAGCASGAKISTANITNNSGATAYYKVEYSLDNGSNWTQKASNLSVAASATDTSLTQSVPHGSTITWRFQDSSTSGDFTGANWENESNTSATVDCDPNSVFSNSFGSCASGSATATLSITNNEISTGSLDLTDSSVLITSTDEIVIPSSEYSKVATGDAVIYTQGSSGAQGNLTDGTTYYIIKSGTDNRVKLATTNLNAILGTAIDLTAVASGGTAHTLTGLTAYYKVEYKIDDGSYTTADGNVSVAIGATDTSVTASVPHGSTITWKITDSFTSNDFTNMSEETQA